MGYLIRFLILALVLWLVIRYLKKIFGSEEKTKPLNTKTTQPMISCAKCGVYIPKDQAFVVGENYYCCKDHVPS
ncbi:MAG: OadG family protein [Gammaproteobacteria bacterium]|nr:OadG family protein [Gammaproteobacteria bacterium]